jgi:hypothetical protein
VYANLVAKCVLFSGGRPLVRGKPYSPSLAFGVGISVTATSFKFGP